MNADQVARLESAAGRAINDEVIDWFVQAAPARDRALQKLVEHGWVHVYEDVDDGLEKVIAALVEARTLAVRYETILKAYRIEVQPL